MRKKHLTAAAAAAIVFAGSGLAMAYWTTNGGGTGSAATAEGAASLTIESSPITGLAPGNYKTSTLTIVNNDNDTDVQFGEITWKTDAPKACAGDIWIKGLPSNQTVLHGGKNTYDLFIGMNNSESNQDDCKGKKITITYSA